MFDYGDISEGVVTLEHHEALSNPYACHVDKTRAIKVSETLQDEFKMVVPDFKKLIVLDED